MTLPPADWYDDPENPLQYRYWDGTEWTEHRSPKAPPPPPGARRDGSVWEIVGDLFAVVSSTWREAVVVSIPLALGTLVGAALLYFGIGEAINVDVQEFLDRVTAPGFDWTEGDDKEYIDSIDVTITSKAVVALTVGSIIWWVGASLSSLGLGRLFVANRNGLDLRADQALRGGARRIPRLLLFTLQVTAAAVGVALAVGVTGVVAPALLLLTIPGALALTVWAIPYLMVAALAVGIAPRGQGAIAVARDAVRNRWGHVFVRLLVLILLSMALSLPLGIISSAVSAMSLWGYGVFSGLVQAFQMVVSAAGYVIIYVGLSAPVDNALCDIGSPDGRPDQPVD